MVETQAQYVGVALITRITHMRIMRKINIHNCHLHKILRFFTIGAALNGKNFLPLGANSFL